MKNSLVIADVEASDHVPSRGSIIPALLPDSNVVGPCYAFAPGEPQSQKKQTERGEISSHCAEQPQRDVREAGEPRLGSSLTLQPAKNQRHVK